MAVLLNLHTTIQRGTAWRGSDEWRLSSNFCEGCAHVMRSLVKESAAHIPEFPIPRMPDKYQRSQLRFNFSIHRL
jgi:hypothetical protein